MQAKNGRIYGWPGPRTKPYAPPPQFLSLASFNGSRRCFIASPRGGLRFDDKQGLFFRHRNPVHHNEFLKRPRWQTKRVTGGLHARWGQSQSMSFPLDYHDLGRPEGIKRVLKGRGLWPERGLMLECLTTQNRPGNPGRACCARRVLEAVRDFRDQK